MASSKRKSSAGFSFDRDPGKIGGEDGKEFSFDDIPVLGKEREKEKKKGSFSFDNDGVLSPVSKQDAKAAMASDNEISPLEPGVKEREGSQSEEDSDIYSSALETVPPEHIEPQEGKWDKGHYKNIPLWKIGVCLAPLVIFLGLVFLFFTFYRKDDESSRTAEAGADMQGNKSRNELNRRLEEEKKKTLAEFENILSAADEAFKKGHYSEALTAYQKLLEKNLEKASLLVKVGECSEKIDKDDDAIKAYRESMETDSGTPEPYIRLASILNKKGNYPESLQELEKARKLFPNEIRINILFAETYYFLGRPGDALREFEKLKKTDLSLAQLKMYGALLRENMDKKKAGKIYYYAAKTFRDLDCYIIVAELADELQEKINIMAYATGAFNDDNKKNTAILLLSEFLALAGRKEEVAEQLGKINASALPPEFFLRFVKLVIGTGKADRLESDYIKVLNAHPNDIILHKRLQNCLSSSGHDKLCLEIYSKWWAARSNDTFAEYLYARALGNTESAKGHYLALLKLNPEFHDAYFELGHLYTMERDWYKAEEAYSRYVSLRPENEKARYLLALIKLHLGKGEKAIDEYENFLKKVKVRDSERALKVINLVQKLSNPAMAEKYLEDIKQDPKLQEQYRFQELKTKFIYGKVSEEDFSGTYPKSAREYHILYLLSNGKSREVLLMTTPPEEFPDFWKVFLCWEEGIASWEQNAELLISKNKKHDPLSVIAALWLGKITPDEVRKMVDSFHPDSESLLYFMIAEKYKKDGNTIKAKVCYLKALADKLNPLYSVIRYYSKESEKRLGKNLPK